MRYTVYHQENSKICIQAFYWVHLKSIHLGSLIPRSSKQRLRRKAVSPKMCQETTTLGNGFCFLSRGLIGRNFMQIDCSCQVIHCECGQLVANFNQFGIPHFFANFLHFPQNNSVALKSCNFEIFLSSMSRKLLGLNRYLWTSRSVILSFLCGILHLLASTIYSIHSSLLRALSIRR